jgi:IS30 family transposase
MMKHRNGGPLTQEQRYHISALVKTKHSQGQITELVGCSKSTISRELSRNCDGRDGSYWPNLAHRKAKARHKIKAKRKRFTVGIEAHVRAKLIENYSPEQIVGHAAREGVECVSHERIYQFVWQDKKRGGKLYRHMRTKGKRYAKRGSARGKRGQILGQVDIGQRPAVVEEKQRVGDLEMDLVIGRGHSGVLLTINDRATGVLKMAILESKEAALVQARAVELLTECKPHLHTITTNNGKEFTYHQKLAHELDVECYFAKPYHSWERAGRPVPSE